MGAGWGFRGGEPFATQTNYWFLALQFALKRAGLELQSRVIVRFAISLEYVWGQGCSSFRAPRHPMVLCLGVPTSRTERGVAVSPPGSAGAFVVTVVAVP